MRIVDGGYCWLEFDAGTSASRCLKWFASPLDTLRFAIAFPALSPIGQWMAVYRDGELAEKVV